MLQILKILDHFNLSQYDPKSFEKYQLLAETMHLSMLTVLHMQATPNS